MPKSRRAHTGKGRDAWMRRGPVNRFRFANDQWLQTAASGSSSGL